MPGECASLLFLFSFGGYFGLRSLPIERIPTIHRPCWYCYYRCHYKAGTENVECLRKLLDYVAPDEANDLEFMENKYMLLVLVYNIVAVKFVLEI